MSRRIQRMSRSLQSNEIMAVPLRIYFGEGPFGGYLNGVIHIEREIRSIRIEQLNGGAFGSPNGIPDGWGRTNSFVFLVYDVEIAGRECVGHWVCCLCVVLVAI